MKNIYGSNQLNGVSRVIFLVITAAFMGGGIAALVPPVRVESPLWTVGFAILVILLGRKVLVEIGKAHVLKEEIASGSRPCASKELELCLITQDASILGICFLIALWSWTTMDHLPL
jgi:hypothetical protein